MKVLNLIGITAALVITEACGTASDLELASGTTRSTDSEALEALSSTDDTETRVKLAFQKLRSGGKLQGPGIWKRNANPVGSMNRIEVADDAEDEVYDGYQYTALVPVKADPTRFYLERVGGVAGMTSLAGPFALGEPVRISEFMANKSVTVKKGEFIIADLPYDLANGFVWEATTLPNLGKPHQLVISGSDDGDKGTMRFAWTTDNAKRGEHYTVRFALKRPSDAGDMKNFVVAVTVR